MRDLELDDLAAVRRAFASAPAVAFAQAWRAQLDAGFRPGTVRAGWRPDELLAFAEFEDDDVFTRATADNQRFWELGDTFEIFLETAAPDHYVELHVAPGGLRLQMRIPIPRPSVEPEALMETPAFEGRFWARPGGWTALAVVPLATIGGKPARFSFSRYDYTRGRAEPVHSSTSPHRELNFHRRQEWGTLELA